MMTNNHDSVFKSQRYTTPFIMKQSSYYSIFQSYTTDNILVNYKEIILPGKSYSNTRSTYGIFFLKWQN